jgi:DNA modification methylase
MPAGSVQCCVTSPPYFGLRDYGHDGQIGLEPTPDAYVAEMVAVFREVRRVLRDDGTLWLNLGDSYNGGGASGNNPSSKSTLTTNGGKGPTAPGIKAKDLLGIPWMVAFALRADGWFLRQDIIWAKPNPMPESVLDRCTKAHEYVFLLTKRPRYFYDAKAVAEPATGRETYFGSDAYSTGSGRQDAGQADKCETRNRRSVWTIASQPFSGAHFATMPPDLAETCIKAGTSECGQCPHCGAPWERQLSKEPMVLARSDRIHDLGRTRSSGTMVSPPRSETTGWAPTCTCPLHKPVPQTILDPFGGAGTTALAADRLQRNATIIELNPAYAEIARQRINGEAGLFAPVVAE